MYKHILIASDGSELAEKGVDHGLSLASALGAKVTVVTASEPFQYYTMAYHSTGFGGGDLVERYNASSLASATEVLAKIGEKARKIGIESELVHTVDRLPADAIITTAKEKGADLIVMASHGRRGVSRLLLGSQAVEVLSTSEVPVLIVR